MNHTRQAYTLEERKAILAQLEAIRRDASYHYRLAAQEDNRAERIRLRERAAELEDQYERIYETYTQAIEL